MPIIKEREEHLCSYLNVHTSLVYFCYRVLPPPPFFLVIIGSFCVEKLILKKVAAPSYDLQLNTLFLLVEIQWIPWVQEEFESHYTHLCLLTPMCQSYRCTDRSTLYTVGALVWIHRNLGMHFFNHLSGWTDYMPHMFSAGSFIIMVRDWCPWITLKLPLNLVQHFHIHFPSCMVDV
jgi:hypothetical protein